MSLTMALLLVLRQVIKVLPPLINPPKFDEVPDGLKDPDGKWFAIHYGTLGFFVNVDALAGAEVFLNVLLTLQNLNIEEW